MQTKRLRWQMAALNREGWDWGSFAERSLAWRATKLDGFPLSTSLAVGLLSWGRSADCLSPSDGYASGLFIASALTRYRRLLCRPAFGFPRKKTFARLVRCLYKLNRIDSNVNWFSLLVEITVVNLKFRNYGEPFRVFPCRTFDWNS